MIEMTLSDFKENIINPKFENWESLLINLINIYNTHKVKNDIQDIVLRLLERRKELGSTAFLLDQLIGELGLYPYLQEDKLEFRDKIRQTLFSAPSPVEKTFHVKQAEVFHTLMSGKSKNLEKVDFFVIDEFYKLAPTSPDDYRCDRLNLAFHKLHKQCQHFYMLGPNIEGISDGIEKSLNCNLVKYDHFKTVSTNEFYYEIKSTGADKKKDEERDIHLASILNSVGAEQQTVIFCKSPKRANNLINTIINLDIIKKSKKNSGLSSWLKEVYHQDWNLALGIEHGIACHHAKLPRSLGSLIVEMFNSSKINILVCTSTLIEGVNTNAKNMIVYDDCLTRNEKLDTFTFNNISGRSGRMFEHYVGNVYILGDKPQEALPFVDIPIVSQSDNASVSMLLQISEELYPTHFNMQDKTSGSYR